MANGLLCVVVFFFFKPKTAYEMVGSDWSSDVCSSDLSPETIRALEYGKELYQTFVPGTLSWLDPNNNKAFLDGQISVTNNGISIYYAAKNATDPKVKELAPDIGHANFPIGPIGRATELHLFSQAMIFK